MSSRKLLSNPVKPRRYFPQSRARPARHSDGSSEEEEDDEDDVQVEEKEVEADQARPANVPVFELKDENLDDRFARERAAEAADKSSIPHDAGESSHSESESESSTGLQESEEEAPPRRVLPRPVFVGKQERQSAALEDTPEAELERRKSNSRLLIQERIKREQAGQPSDDGVDDTIDDTDDLDPSVERAAWKLRELLRVRRERQSLEEREAERVELERRRNLGEEEKAAEDAEYLDKQKEEKEATRGEMRFLQKYYHKGAFYQEDDILRRNFNLAKEDDIISKELLPKVMQVRGDDFGKRGRTKWTHLSAEDTSRDAQSAWFDAGSSIHKRQLSKLGGLPEAESKKQKK